MNLEKMNSEKMKIENLLNFDKTNFTEVWIDGNWCINQPIGHNIFHPRPVERTWYMDW